MERNETRSLTLRSHVGSGGEEGGGGGGAGDEERARMTIRWVALAAAVERRGEERRGKELKAEAEEGKRPTRDAHAVICLV
jgi:hypothetical protein